ncbi:hypothetical protein HG530_003365 [Fusarium avenaceum]|nr:hypothetical protein HG530_003365 [Fusarium avenaceum]
MPSLLGLFEDEHGGSDKGCQGDHADLSIGDAAHGLICELLTSSSARDSVHLIGSSENLTLVEEIDQDKVGGGTPLLLALLKMLAQRAILSSAVAVDGVDVLRVGEEQAATL